MRSFYFIRNAIQQGIRKESLQGRSYLVAPMRLIVPGVLEGSEGPLYYPPEEVGHDPSVWNGMPLVVYHPQEGDKQISARSPEVLDKQGVGLLLNSGVDDKGALVGEGWFDIQMANKVSPGLINRIEKGNPVEVSTGLRLEKYPVSNGTHFNGIPYNYSTGNYRPDHIAILPDQVGACSVRDGCGVNVVHNCCEGKELGDCCENCRNAKQGQPRSLATGYWKRMGAGTGVGPVHEAAQTGAMVLSDSDRTLGQDAHYQSITGLNPPNWAMDEAKWEKAKMAAEGGNYDDDTYWAVVSHIYQKMGGTIGGNSTTINSLQENAMDRQATILWLTTNCSCWKGDTATLNTFSNERLAALKQGAEKIADLETVANTLSKKFKVSDPKDLTELVTNRLQLVPKKGAKGKGTVENAEPVKEGEEEEDMEDDEEMEYNCGEEMGGKKEVTTNRNKTWGSISAWLKDPNSAPTQVKEVVVNALKVEKAEKQNIINKLVSNAPQAKREELKTKLKAKSLPDLKDMLELVGNSDTSSRNRRGEEEEQFGGLFTPDTGVNNRGSDGEEDYLDVPVINWREPATR